MRKTIALSIVAIAALAVIAALTGCSTDLTVHRRSSGVESAPATGEISYALPRTAITLTGTATLKSCTAVYNKTFKIYLVKLDVSVAATALQSTEPDPEQRYFISYDESRTWMKETNFSVVSNAGGTLQSFNGTINDQAGAYGVAAIGTIVQIGGAIATGGVTAPGLVSRASSGGAKLPPAPEFCPKVRDALTDIATRKAEIANIQKHPAKDAVGAARQAQDIAAKQTEIAGIVSKKLSQAFSFKWIPSRSDGHVSTTDSRYYLASTKVDLVPIIDNWLSVDGKAFLDKHPAAPMRDDDPRAEVAAPYLLTVAVDRKNAGDGSDAVDAGKTVKGLVIRDPAQAVFRICRVTDAKCTDEAAIPRENGLTETTADVGPRLAVSLPQFGRVVILPEHSGLFENANLSVALNADGTISTIGYHDTGTAATGIAGLGTAAGSVTSNITARNGAVAAANTATAAQMTAKSNDIQAISTYNKALADCLTNAATITKAGGTPGTCPPGD